ncbi:cupin domain-containing protein [Segetibacter sp. 3557_3]|uniref:cupin domain-containing protein n=1 Tax=Segetibacter sp. 3557_3 TaxID=2547429 RepID=UPI0010586163|nr:cupin domain-containing protein [Segetibacter sp. 3557_3]TDH21321.1 cupin domain-containing protein [Segetibacter sp. 3557_3]
MNNFQTTTATNISDYRNYQGGYFKTLISPEQTNGTMALVDMTLPKGVEPPPHCHTNEDETFYVLEGAMTFRVGEKTVEARAGDSVFAPRMVPHEFIINSTTARFLTVITPGKFLEYFMEFSFPAAEELSIVPPQGPPPPAIITHMTKQLSEKYGVLFI